MSTNTIHNLKKKKKKVQIPLCFWMNFIYGIFLAFQWYTENSWLPWQVNKKRLETQKKSFFLLPFLLRFKIYSLKRARRKKIETFIHYAFPPSNRWMDESRRIVFKPPYRVVRFTLLPMTRGRGIVRSLFIWAGIRTWVNYKSTPGETYVCPPNWLRPLFSEF